MSLRIQGGREQSGRDTLCQLPAGLEVRQLPVLSLRLGSQRRLRERVELRDRSARDAEDLAAPPPEGDPGLECGDAFGAQALEQREWQIGWQCVFHVGQFSHFGAFAKRDLTSSRDSS